MTPERVGGTMVNVGTTAGLSHGMGGSIVAVSGNHDDV